MIDAYQVVVAGSFISDFTPAKLGGFLKPLMVRTEIDVGKGLASVIIDHWADALTATLLGIDRPLLIVMGLPSPLGMSVALLGRAIGMTGEPSLEGVTLSG